MKILFDENLPPVLAESIHVPAQGEGCQVHHVIPWMGAGTSDANWIKEVGREGGWIVVSNDHHIWTRPREVMLWQSHGVIGFILPKAFNQMRFWEKAAFLTRWWETIVDTAGSAAPGNMFPIPPKWTPSALVANTPNRRKR